MRVAARRGMATHLARDILPGLPDHANVFLVAIGTAETGAAFARLTGFPAHRLLADPDNASYDALRLNQGFFVTYLTPLAPVSIAKQLVQGGLGDFLQVLRQWEPWCGLSSHGVK